MILDKVVDARIWGVTNQNSAVTLTATGDTASNTFTPNKNPLRGSRLWDECTYVLTGVSVAGGATGGSYNVTVSATIDGVNACKIAQNATTIGPNSPATIILDNVHQSKASPLPNRMAISQAAAGGGIWFQMYVIAKQYRGVLGSPSISSAERIIEGTFIRGNSSTPWFSGDEGANASATFTLGTSGTHLGMNRMRLWDTALFWAVAGATLNGTATCSMVSTVGGSTVTIAATGAAAIGVASEVEQMPLVTYGPCPNPTQIIWTKVTGDGISDFRVIGIAKTGRGSMAKR